MDADEAAREAEMAAGQAAAYARLRVAVSWHQAADAELDALQRPSWGGVVNRWHDAQAAVIDSLETCEAYEAFPPVHS